MSSADALNNFPASSCPNNTNIDGSSSAYGNSSMTALCTGRIFATYPAPHLSLANGFLDQVCVCVYRCVNVVCGVGGCCCCILVCLFIVDYDCTQTIILMAAAHFHVYSTAHYTMHKMLHTCSLLNSVVQ